MGIRASRPKKRPHDPRRTLFGGNPLRERVRQSRRFTRTHRRRHRRRLSVLPVVLRAAGVGVLLGVAVLVGGQTGGAIQSGFTTLVQGVMDIIPEPVSDPDVRPTPPLQALGLAPLLDPLPEATREAALLVSGRLPSHLATAAARPRVEILLNGFLAAVPEVDADGRFSASLALESGPNTVIALSVRGDERAEAPARVVVLDRTPPGLIILRPEPNQVLDSTLAVVSGRTEVGATVTVNEAVAAVSTEGAFVMTFQAPSGPFELVILARDAAGNETKRELTVVVPQTTITALSVSVSLDPDTVQPGEPLTAVIEVSFAGTPLSGVAMRVNLGLSTVASGVTDADGRLSVELRAPDSEGIVQVIALTAPGAGIAGQGAAALNVSLASPSPSPQAP